MRFGGQAGVEVPRLSVTGELVVCGDEQWQAVLEIRLLVRKAVACCGANWRRGLWEVSRLKPHLLKGYQTWEGL